MDPSIRDWVKYIVTIQPVYSLYAKHYTCGILHCQGQTGGHIDVLEVELTLYQLFAISRSTNAYW